MSKRDLVEYHSYLAAKSRCEKPHNSQYARYGGRGIEFRFKSFEEFYAELGDKPTPDHSVDRIDNDGHYETGNVRWATHQEQGRNMASTRFITLDGRTQCHTDWEQEMGLEQGMIYSRLRKGWDEERAVREPVYKGRLFTARGKTQHLTAWANEIGMKDLTLRRRISMGLSIEDALSLPLWYKAPKAEGK